MRDTDWMVDMLYRKRKDRIRQNLLMAFLATVSGWMVISTIVGTIVIFKWIF